MHETNGGLGENPDARKTNRQQVCGAAEKCDHLKRVRGPDMIRKWRAALLLCLMGGWVCEPYAGVSLSTRMQGVNWFPSIREKRAKQMRASRADRRNHQPTRCGFIGELFAEIAAAAMKCVFFR